MITIRSGTALSIVCAAASAALFLSSTPAAARHGGHGREVEVGPIWNQMDAERKCPQAARAAGGTWTGQWHTTRMGQMSVCEIAGGHGGGHKDRDVEVGPIWNQMDAERKCPHAARAAGGTWTGQWHTTRPGQMSVCEIKR
jgi:hypothetical protein